MKTELLHIDQVDKSDSQAKVSKLIARAFANLANTWHLVPGAVRGCLWGGAAVLASAQIGSAQTFLYDVNKDFSDANNPNGAWSFNYNSTPIPIHQTFWWGQAGWGNSSSGDGCVIKGSQSGLDVGPNDWQPGDVMLHALSIPYGGDSTFLNVKWTAPANGSISISGRAWDGAFFGGRDAGWSLLVDNQVIATHSSVYGLVRTDSLASFSNDLLPGKSLTDINVQAGEDVEFRVFTDTYYGHFVGLEEQVQFNATAVPEPGEEAAACGVALVGIAAFRRFLKR